MTSHGSEQPFLEAADAFVDLVAALPASAWAAPGLGDWDLRSLVGHTGRALTTVLTAVGREPDSEEVRSAGGYLARARGLTAEQNEQIRQRGQDAGEALGEDPAGALRDTLHQVRAALAAIQGRDPVVHTAMGGMLLSAYLPTRTFELTVHSLDIAAATGTEFRPPVGALRVALGVACDAALSLDHGPTLLRALTGREPLAPGFTVVP